MRDVEPPARRRGLYKTNIALVYLSIIDDYGLAGVRRQLGALGMKHIGTSKYYRYLTYVFSA